MIIMIIIIIIAIIVIIIFIIYCFTFLVSPSNFISDQDPWELRLHDLTIFKEYPVPCQAFTPIPPSCAHQIIVGRENGQSTYIVSGGMDGALYVTNLGEGLHLV